jgi:hypothetical protein
MSSDDQVIYAVDVETGACNGNGPTSTTLRVNVSDQTDAPADVDVTATVSFGGASYGTIALSWDGKTYSTTLGPRGEDFAATYNNPISVSVKAEDKAGNTANGSAEGFLVFQDCDEG